MVHRADDTIRQLILDGMDTLETILDKKINKLQQGDAKSANKLRVKRQELLQLRKALAGQNTSELIASLLKITTQIKSGELWSVNS